MVAELPGVYDLQAAIDWAATEGYGLVMASASTRAFGARPTSAGQKGKANVMRGLWTADLHPQIRWPILLNRITLSHEPGTESRFTASWASS
jgi:hypothetical protein